MNLLKTALESEFACRLGWALVHSLWMGIVCAAVLMAAMVILRRRSANARYLCACAAMLLLLSASAAMYFLASAPKKPQAAMATPAGARSPEEAPPLLLPHSRRGDLPSAAGPIWEHDKPAAPVAVLPPKEPVGAPAAVPASSPRPLSVRAAELIEPALPCVVMAWMVGVVLAALWQMSSWLSAMRIRRLASLPDDSGLAETAARLARLLGLSRPAKVLQSMILKTPAVIGLLRPVILLPASLCTALPPAQLEAILLHELAHIRRMDYLVNLLQTLVETLLFYHPAVWYISGRIRIERENCCDDITIAHCGDAPLYADALVSTAAAASASTSFATHGKRWPRKPATAISADGGKLLPRIRRILGLHEQQPARSALLSAAIALSLVLALIALPLALSMAAPNTPTQPAATGSTSQPAETLPELRFLAWQEDQPAMAVNAVPRAWRPDGQLADSPDEQRTLRSVQGMGCSGPDPQSRFLQLWFFHPDADEKSIVKCSLKDDQDRALHGRPEDPFGSRVQEGWLLICKAAAQSQQPLPTSVNIELQYAAGPWQEIGSVSPADESPSLPGLFSVVLGPDQRAEPGAPGTSIEFQRKARQADAAQYSFVAITNDGKELAPRATYSWELKDNAVREAHFFAAPISAIKSVTARRRSSQTVTFRNVSIEPGVRTKPSVQRDTPGSPTTQPATATMASPRSGLDSQLRDACLYFNDREHRRREVAIQLFEDYLTKHPDSVYRPDIYFCIGQLYSSHRKEEQGEDYRPDLMAKYYKLAHDGYGMKYSASNRCAWASVNNQPSSTLADRLEYYNWLVHLERSASADDMYPIVDMEIMAGGNRILAEWTLGERQQSAKNLRSQLPISIEVAERNIVEKSNSNDLNEIIRLYPGTYFAKLAKSKLGVLDDIATRPAEGHNREATTSTQPAISATSVAATQAVTSLATLVIRRHLQWQTENSVIQGCSTGMTDTAEQLIERIEKSKDRNDSLIMALALKGPSEQSVAMLTRLLASAEPSHRLMAARGFALWGWKDGLQVLQELAVDDDIWRASHAGWSLLALGEKLPKPKSSYGFAQMSEILEGQSQGREAGEIPGMMKALVRGGLLESLVRDATGWPNPTMHVGNTAQERMRSIAESSDPMVRRTATLALGLYSQDHPVQDKLLQLLDDKDHLVALHAARWLAVRGRPEAVPFLTKVAAGEIVMTSSEFERNAAAWAMLALDLKPPMGAKPYSDQLVNQLAAAWDRESYQPWFEYATRPLGAFETAGLFLHVTQNAGTYKELISSLSSPNLDADAAMRILSDAEALSMKVRLVPLSLQSVKSGTTKALAVTHSVETIQNGKHSTGAVAIRLAKPTDKWLVDDVRELRDEEIQAAPDMFWRTPPSGSSAPATTGTSAILQATTATSGLTARPEPSTISTTLPTAVAGDSGDMILWGEVVEGGQYGISLDREGRDFRLRDRLALKFHVRNAGQRAMEEIVYPPAGQWSISHTAENGTQAIYILPPSAIPARPATWAATGNADHLLPPLASDPRIVSVAPSQAVVVGQIELNLPKPAEAAALSAAVKPGQCIVRYQHHIPATAIYEPPVSGALAINILPAASSQPATQPAMGKAAPAANLAGQHWGPATEGLAARLQCDKLVWATKEAVVVQVDLRNMSKADWTFPLTQQGLDIEVDDQEYEWDGPVENPGQTIRPAQAVAGIIVILDGHWVKKGTPATKLVLDRGKHYIRVKLSAVPVDGADEVDVFSNRVSFWVLPADYADQVAKRSEQFSKAVINISRPGEANARVEVSGQAEMRKLLAFFPDLGRKSGTAAGWEAGGTVELTKRDATTTKIVLSGNDNLNTWSAGQGDWSVCGDFLAYFTKLQHTATQPATQPATATTSAPAMQVVESASSRAFRAYTDATDELLKGSSRERVADIFTAVAQSVPDERLGKVSAELADRLREMVEEDKSFAAPADPSKLSEKDRLAWLVYRLRDVVAQRESFIPGRCRVLFNPQTKASAAVELRKMGKAAIQTLIALLGDRRPTRSSSLPMNGGAVLRYEDVALQIIEAIAGQEFDRGRGRGTYLSNAPKDVHKAIIQEVDAWWQANKDKSEAQWLREVLARGMGSYWFNVETANRLIELEGKDSLDLFRQLAKSEGDNPHVAAKLYQAGGNDVIGDLRAMLDSSNVEVRTAARRLLIQAGQKDVIEKAYSELAATVEDSQTARDLLQALAYTRRPEELSIVLGYVNKTGSPIAAPAMEAIQHAMSPSYGNHISDEVMQTVVPSVAAAMDNEKVALAVRYSAAIWLIAVEHASVQVPNHPAKTTDLDRQALIKQVQDWRKRWATQPATQPAKH